MANESSFDLDAGSGAPVPSAADVSSGRRHLAEGDLLFAAGQFEAALAHFQQALRLQKHPGCHYRVARAAWSMGKPALARAHLQELVRILPRNPDAHLALSSRYLEDGMIDLALQHTAIALGLAPDRQAVVIARAGVLAEAGEEQAALELIRPMIGGGESPLAAANLYAEIAPKLGQEEVALRLVRAVLEGHAPGGKEAAQLHFRAAGLLERLGRYDEAFRHARLGHDARRQPYDPDRNTKLTSGLIEYFTRSMVRSLPRATHGSTRPLFIVGMPRSGTSLVEQILDSHPAIHGGGELPTLNEIACGFNRTPWAPGEEFPACLELLTIRHANQLAARYLSRLDEANSSAPYVTDKLPINFRDLWLVQILFPDARVIHCMRDPLDTCVSCYMSYFDSVNDFAQDLGTLGRYYRDYRRLIKHWESVLDVPILNVGYEALVKDVEGHTRQMLEFLRLDWDERCLRFHENRRYVATASRSQVRRPIYQSSVGRWKHYQKHLAALLRELPPG